MLVSVLSVNRGLYIRVYMRVLYVCPNGFLNFI